MYWTIPDRDEFSFTPDGVNDSAFSIESVVNVTAAQQVIIVKGNPGVGINLGEWMMRLEADRKFLLACFKSDYSAQSTRVSDAAVSVGYHHLAAVKATGTAATGSNITLYVDGAVVASTGIAVGTYTGMTNTSVAVSVGAQLVNGATTESYLASNLPTVQVYGSELSSTEVYLDYVRARSLYGF